MMFNPACKRMKDIPCIGLHNHGRHVVCLRYFVAHALEPCHARGVGERYIRAQQRDNCRKLLPFGKQ